ncbi:MAG: tripartite tricarboxylate transporter substrate binding protein [Pseudolabrys sp.]|nr:tripartite tricarboxylate transporter substrate binding protein [Pseudolabrys sp.]MCW5683111.1 tripartite tricarboxylate transporter substrate binding protein [Pseudolabrys sp.]
MIKTTIRLAVTAAVVALGVQAAAAQGSAYPSQTVKIIVPFSAGSLTDLLARTLSDKLAPMWKQPVIVENHPGVAGTALAAKSPADGYTLLLVSNGHTVTKMITSNLPFDPVNDFVGVSKLASMPMIMIAPPKADHRNLADVVKLAQQNPGKLSYASAGLASTAYIAGESFKQTKNLQILHVPYKGTPDAQTSIMRGDTDFFFSPASVSDDLINSGKVNGVAVTGKQRIGTLPNVPTFAEAGMPEFEYDAWFGLLAPAQTPKAIRDKISQDIAKVMAMPDVRDRLAKQGTVVTSSTPDAFDALVKSDTERYSKILAGNAKK